MGFRFPLATLLRLREIAEQREERLLGQILNQMAQSRLSLATLEQQRRDLIAQRELTLQQPTSGFDLTGFYGQLRGIDDLERTGREHLAKLVTLRDQQMKIYETAHRNLEVLAGLEGDQRDAFRLAQGRKEQNAMDDNFSSRRNIN
jgi:flagellar FliJ protein